MSPTGSAHLNMTLAALCGVGGIIGYAKKGSVPSLVAGFALGAAYGGAAYLVSGGDGERGFALGTAASAVLAASMAARLAKTPRKIMPAGVLTVLGVAGGVYNLSKYREWAA